MSNVSGLGPRLRFTALPDRPQRLLKAYRHLLPLYAELARRSGPRASVQVRQSVLAEALGLDARTVRRQTAELKALGLIEVIRTRRTAITWLPDHANYSADWDAYREKAEAKRQATYAQAPHMEGPPVSYGARMEPTPEQSAHMDRTSAHMDRTRNQVRQDTDVLSRQDTGVLSIEEEVPLEEVPSSRRPEGQAASDDGTYGNYRSDGLQPIAAAFPIRQVRPSTNTDRYGLDDPYRPPGAPDWEVHDTCGWNFGHPKHISECLEAATG